MRRSSHSSSLDSCVWYVLYADRVAVEEEPKMGRQLEDGSPRWEWREPKMCSLPRTRIFNREPSGALPSTAASLRGASARRGTSSSSRERRGRSVPTSLFFPLVGFSLFARFPRYPCSSRLTD